MLVKLQSLPMSVASYPPGGAPLAAQDRPTPSGTRKGRGCGSFKEASKGQEMPRPFTLQGTQGLLWLLGGLTSLSRGPKERKGSVPPPPPLPGSLPHPELQALVAEIAPIRVTTASLALLV